MTEPLIRKTNIDEAIAALRSDLIAEGGPRISTMRNYRFAILPYSPAKEFDLRQRIRRLSDELKAQGWNVLTISLHALLMKRLRVLSSDILQSQIGRERRLHTKSPERALAYIKEKVLPLVEGPDGIAADVTNLIADFARQYPSQAERSLVFIGRAGGLYPFYRTSALLKHIDGRTQNIPVVLLYPGKPGEGNALSFMEEVPPDRDYRPRIYP